MNAEAYWISRARRLALRHNTARWLDLFLPAGVGVAVLGAAAMLVLRQGQMEVAWFWQGLEVTFGLAAAGALWLALRRSLSVPRALVRLEELGHLHNQLSVARAGIGAWPAPRPVRDSARWRWSRLGTPAVTSAFLLAASAWVPLPARDGRVSPQEMPLAWSQVQTWLDLLDRSKLVDPPALEKMKSQLGELQQKPPEQWFQQSSLEAGDSLRQQAEQAIQGMQRDLRHAEDVVAKAQKLGEQPQPDQVKKLESALNPSLQGLQMGNLPLNQELLKQLKDFQGMGKQMSPGDMESLRQRLAEGQQVCKECVGPNRGEGEDNESDGAYNGEGGGGNDTPLTFKEKRTNLRSKTTESLTSEDLSLALPADVAGITAGEHEVDKNAPAGPVAGGAISSAGQGGEAVWRNQVLPQERAVLRDFFK